MVAILVTDYNFNKQIIEKSNPKGLKLLRIGTFRSRLARILSI